MSDSCFGAPPLPSVGAGGVAFITEIIVNLILFFSYASIFILLFPVFLSPFFLRPSGAQQSEWPGVDFSKVGESMMGNRSNAEKQYLQLRGGLDVEHQRSRDKGLFWFVLGEK